jgi:pimeloyl-ACP methyl ester carboxylesterase
MGTAGAPLHPPRRRLVKVARSIPIVLLERAHVPGPYVLAGHSLGGMFVLSYANRYPSQVGGVVLLDSMHPRQTHTAANMGPVLDVVLGGRPLGVVTAGTGTESGWTQHQNGLGTLSTHTFQRMVAGSTHQSLIDDPKHAAVSSGAIYDVVVAVRNKEGA